MEKIEVLRQIRLGQRVAEEEVESLESYFVETNQWNEIFEGEKDLVFGPKGAGKSALYALVSRRSERLRERNILVTLAENPIGATVFKNLEVDPPPSEAAFILLWKLYTLTLIADIIRAQGIKAEESEALVSSLNQAGLLPRVASRESLFASVRKFIGRLFDRGLSSIETSVTMDASTGLPVFSGKLNLDKNPELRIDALPVEELIYCQSSAGHKWRSDMDSI